MFHIDHVKKNFIHLAISFLISLSFSIANAQPADTKTAKITAQTTSSANQTAQTPATELAVVRAQLEDNRKFQDQLLATVYWSLGTLATVAMLVSGFGWFANTRMYERDKTALERELRAQIREDIHSLRGASEAALIAKFSEHESVINMKIDTHVEQAVQNFKKNTAEVESKFSVKISQTSNYLADLANSVLRLQIDAKLSERESWRKQKIYRNVLQANVSALVFANTLKDTFVLGNILDFLAQDMDDAITSKSNPIDSFLTQQIVRALESVEGDHAYAASTLKNKVGSLVSG